MATSFGVNLHLYFTMYQKMAIFLTFVLLSLNSVYYPLIFRQMSLVKQRTERPCSYKQYDQGLHLLRDMVHVEILFFSSYPLRVAEKIIEFSVKIWYQISAVAKKKIL